MYAKILVPLVGSERAERVLLRVEELAEAGLTEFALLRVIEAVIVETEAQVGEYLEARAEALRAQGYAASWRLGTGSPVDVILAEADVVDADLVAMTSHGRGTNPARYGRVANGVMTRLTRPLMLMRVSESGHERARREFERAAASRG